MRTQHIFSRVREDAKGKENELTNKLVVANVSDYSSTGIDIREWITDATIMNNLSLLTGAHLPKSNDEKLLKE